jgi:hypothetical protein
MKSLGLGLILILGTNSAFQANAFQDIKKSGDTDLEAVDAVIGGTAPGECVPLQLTGSLLDGTLIEGEDLVVLLEKK